jgi:hypothetical protein
VELFLYGLEIFVINAASMIAVAVVLVNTSVIKVTANKKINSASSQLHHSTDVTKHKKETS